MKAPVITLANDSYRNTSVVSLRFEKDFGIICKQQLRHKSSRTITLI
jgi:hypothetical protein